MQYQSRSENYSTSLRNSPTKWSGGVKKSKGYAYKTASYQYSTPESGSSGGGSQTYLSKSADKNIDQLDALLEDLKTERQLSREKDHSLSYRTIERSTNEVPSSGTVSKTTRIVRTCNQQHQHPNYDDVELLSNSADYSTIRSNRSMTRNDFQAIDKSCGSRNLSPGGGSSFYEAKKTQLYESNRSLNRPNMDLIPLTNSTANVNTSSSPTNDIQMEKDFNNIALTDDILPVPGTKVTTTVRTYTYEIPATNSTNTLTRKNLIYDASDSANIVQAPPQQHPHSRTYSQSLHVVPQTVIYNAESYTNLRKDPRAYHTDQPPIVTHQSYELRDNYETNTVQRSIDGPRGSSISPRHGQPLLSPNDTTIIYNRTQTVQTSPTDRSHYTENVPQYMGPHSPVRGPPSGPGPGSGHTTHYIYKETTNTLNTIPGPGGPGDSSGPVSPVGNSGLHEPLQPRPMPLLPTVDQGSYPPGHNVTYKYTTTTATATSPNGTRRAPDYGDLPLPNLPPTPFPLDGGEFPINNAAPPQRVEDLMQTFGNADVVDKTDMNMPRKREVETAVASSNQQQIIPSINRAGKEVYYPPGHDMMLTKREQMSASSAGGGRWAKSSGRYEYESGYKSKTKTKAGGAVVPLCLPMCCAMPCTIM